MAYDLDALAKAVCLLPSCLVYWFYPFQRLFQNSSFDGAPTWSLPHHSRTNPTLMYSYITFSVSLFGSGSLPDSCMFSETWGLTIPFGLLVILLLSCDPCLNP